VEPETAGVPEFEKNEFLKSWVGQKVGMGIEGAERIGAGRKSRSDLESELTPSTALGERRNEPPGEGVVHGKDEERFTVKLLVVQTPVSEEHHCVEQPG